MILSWEVEVVLAKLAQKPNLDELFVDYPRRLTLDDVKACLLHDPSTEGLSS